MTRGIAGIAGYLPYYRVERKAIAAMYGGGGGKGTRAAASFDEDATTLAFAAASAALHSAPGVSPETLWFATTTPPYLDKSNASAVHSALGLAPSVSAFDAIGSVRSAMGALRAAVDSSRPTLVATGDLRSGRPNSADESFGGDAGAAVLVCSDTDAPLIAEIIGWGTTTEDILDQWRTPGASFTKHWEERFGEELYETALATAWADALKDAGIDSVDRVLVAGTNARSNTVISKKFGEAAGDPLLNTIGNTAAAHPLLSLALALETAEPGSTIALVVLSDGVEVAIFKVNAQVPAVLGPNLAGKRSLEYGKFLTWREMLPVEPPKRPEPGRTSASAAARSAAWKFGFQASVDDGEVHLPPRPGATERRPMGETLGTVATFTIDRLSYSQSPPLVFAVIDFDGGGRFPMELTDVSADEVEIGMRVKPTFRRLFTIDGIHNYFWKATPA
ncbi:MAG TPA: OB-fold domain-containing protein [Jatrophihabitans sp.]|jgi:3-hydroxy-3-methylglutaryl CoA synthase